jgi:hypothetical protein
VEWQRIEFCPNMTAVAHRTGLSILAAPSQDALRADAEERRFAGPTAWKSWRCRGAGVSDAADFLHRKLLRRRRSADFTASCSRR